MTLDQKTPKLLALIAATLIALSPASALAFGATLPTALVTPLQAFSNETYTPAPSATPIPDYNFSNSGVALGVTSPLTVSGNWQDAVSKKPRILLASAIKPMVGQPIVMEGEASYYSRAGCLGCNPLFIMANGQPLNDNALTMAVGADKKHLVGYRARVTNIATGLSATVAITDTGGFYQSKYGNRVADLTIATKEAIGMHGGVGQVRVEVF